MSAFEKTFQVATAAGGFFAGYAWGVTRWAAEASCPATVVSSALVPGGALTAVYALLLAFLFWPLIPGGRVQGLRVAVLPAAFTVSLLVGAVGIRGALWLLG